MHTLYNFVPFLSLPSSGPTLSATYSSYKSFTESGEDGSLIISTELTIRQSLKYNLYSHLIDPSRSHVFKCCK